MRKAMKTRHLLALPALVASISLFNGMVAAEESESDAEMDIFSAEMAALQEVNLFDSLSDTPAKDDSFSQTEVETRFAEARVAQVEVSQVAEDDRVVQDPFMEAATPTTAPAVTPRLSRQPSDSSVRSSRMSTAELRQARALHRARQRTARLEYNLWMGYEPLRPNWNAVPMMTSRYSNRRIYVPMYVNPSR